MANPTSTQVTKEIRSQIKPLLQAEGFSHFTGRTNWRFRPGRIDVINFQSFNSYLAGGVGCTTYSFAVNLGCYLLYVPYPPGSDRLQKKHGKILPKEYECPLRMLMNKQLDQSELPRKSVWYVDPSLKNLESVVHDAAHVIQREAFPWFARFSDDNEVLRTFVEDFESNDGTWGFGTNPSPARSYLIAYTALFLKQKALAITHFEKALQSGCFKGVQPELEKELEHARN